MVIPPCAAFPTGKIHSFVVLAGFFVSFGTSANVRLLGAVIVNPFALVHGHNRVVSCTSLGRSAVVSEAGSFPRFACHPR